MPSSSSSFFDTRDGNKSEAVEAEKWLKSLERCCHTLLNDGENRLNREMKAATLPLKIAILDTGIDSKHPHFLKKIGAKRAFRGIAEFRDGGDSPTHTFPDGEDELPHGTHVAALLNRVAPTAWIYIARVGFGSDEMKPDCVAAAIRYATTVWHVDIISMSLGFKHDNYNICQAIDNARASKVLLFAAVSNGGNTDIPNVAFPASHDQVIRVSAMNSASTKLADFNPSMPPGSLATLGIDVPSAWPGSTAPQPKSGTSMATPILAGITALVLQFIRQLIKNPPKVEDDSKYNTGVWERIEKRLCENTGHMIKILQKLGPPQDQGAPPLPFCAVIPQNWFDERKTLYDLIWGYFRRSMDPDSATEDSEITTAKSQQRLKILECVTSARRLLKSELPARTMSNIAVGDRWNAISEQEFRSHRESGSWLDENTRTPCLWLQGENASCIGRYLTEFCEQHGSIVLRCECNQFDEDEKILGTATILRQANYSALYQVLSHIYNQRLPTPEHFDLSAYYGLDNSKNKIRESLILVQKLTAELLSRAEVPILWVVENYEVLEDERLQNNAGFQQVLHGFLTLVGAVRTPRQVREPCRCLLVSRTRPTPATQEVIGDQIELLDVDEAFG